MNWKILSSPTTATLTNPNSKSFFEIGKKKFNFESKGELSSTVKNKGNLHKITQVTFKTSFQFP